MPLPNEKPASAVYDKGRRGQPLPGCDCVQCFGYCMIDGDEAMRVMLDARHQQARTHEQTD